MTKKQCFINSQTKPNKPVFHGLDEIANQMDVLLSDMKRRKTIENKTKNVQKKRKEIKKNTDIHKDNAVILLPRQQIVESDSEVEVEVEVETGYISSKEERQIKEKLSKKDSSLNDKKMCGDDINSLLSLPSVNGDGLSNVSILPPSIHEIPSKSELEMDEDINALDETQSNNERELTSAEINKRIHDLIEYTFRNKEGGMREANYDESSIRVCNEETEKINLLNKILSDIRINIKNVEIKENIVSKRVAISIKTKDNKNEKEDDSKTDLIKFVEDVGHNLMKSKSLASNFKAPKKSIVVKKKTATLPKTSKSEPKASRKVNILTVPKNQINDKKSSIKCQNSSNVNRSSGKSSNSHLKNANLTKNVKSVTEQKRKNSCRQTENKLKTLNRKGDNNAHKKEEIKSYSRLKQIYKFFPYYNYRARAFYRMAAGRSDPLQDFLNLINKAKNDRKIFTVVGNFYSIRRSLIERGWLEKVRLLVTDGRDSWKQYEHLPNEELFEGMKNREYGEKYRKALIAKLLARHQVDFYWDYTTNPFTVNSDKVKRTIINRYPAGTTRVYGSKAGLCDALSEAHWYCIDGLSCIRYPRTYNLAYDYEVHAFIEDFQMTAAISLLKWVVKTNEDPVLQVISSTGKIPVAVFNFAVLQCQNFIKIKQHKDIDENIRGGKTNDWDVFLDKFYKIMHNVNHFKESNKLTKVQMVEQSRQILKKLERHWPHLTMDGCINLWLLKPHFGSQGSGILICRTLRYILDTIKSAEEKKYVVQKYIERPLLIYNTKFDIRQWFLLSHQPHLQLWMYKDCYLRFSSQTYNLHKLHESIHLTNNSIQCRYKNNVDRDSALPVHNMWHCDTFKTYLTTIGHPNVWKNVIYKEMKEALISIIMCCQDRIIARVNSFELCGVDFMLTEDFHPFLIEINTRPALYNSTPITAKMCPSVLEDVVKVTVDHARNPKAPTGKFEMIYKSKITSKPIENCPVLSVNGINYFKKFKKAEEKVESIKNYSKDGFENGVIQNILNINPEEVKKDVRNTLEKILSIIHVEKEKRIVDKEQNEYRSETFKSMLSEFVNIISSGINQPHGKTTESTEL